MTFRVGQKVVCVNAEGSANLVKGAVYTIETILPEMLGTWGDEYVVAIGILLVETTPDTDYDCFFPTRFRPVVERKTSIEIFTRMLTDQKVEA